MSNYVPILIQLILAVGLAVGLVAISELIGWRRRSKVKSAAYECGVTPQGDANRRFAVKFYLVAIVFILFDVEAVFLLPWAVVFRQLKWLGFIEMLVYIGIVLTGFAYIWQKGVFDWNLPERAEGGPASPIH